MAGLLIAACRPADEAPPRPVDPLPRAVESTPTGPMPLEPAAGLAIEHRIAPGEAHEYLLHLEPDDFFELQVDQRSVDVGLELFDPGGELLLEMDLPIADLGIEPLLGIADQPGGHRLRVKAWESAASAGGSYRITYGVRRPAEEIDRLRARAARRFYSAEKLFLKQQHRQALERYGEALDLWRQAADEFWQAETLDRIGTSHARLGDWESAARFHRRAFDAFQQLGDARFAAVSANLLALDYQKSARMDQAVEWFSRCLELRRQLGDSRGVANALGSLGDVYKVQGETQKALDHFAQALEMLDRGEDPLGRATHMHNLGTLYRRLGMPGVAAEYARQAERIYAALGNVRRQASSLSLLGQLAFEAGDAERALRLLGHSLDLRRQSGDRRGEAVALREIGEVLAARGDVDAAQRHYLEALALLSELSSPRSEAGVLAELGELGNRVGRSEEALEYHRRALEIYDDVGDPVGEAGGLLGVAVSARRLGRLEAARVSGERALEIAEQLRLKPFSEELRFSFFSTAQRFFDFYIDLLMEMDRSDPSAGHGALALQVSERARARSLLDLLSEASAEIRDEAAPQLLEQEKSMQDLLNRSVQIMEDESRSDRSREAATREVQRALERLETVRAAIRRQSPRYAALTQPRPLAADEIRDRVLDRDTVLLEYRLGRERSFLWLMTTDGLASFELPPAAEIERAVRETHALLLQGPRRESEGRTRARLCELGHQLLHPVAGRLADKRLAIVADGALAYVPFAALPDPDSAGPCLAAEPLVVAHEIVYLPSASTLAVLRREEAERAAPPGVVAVLADPVFSADDERLAGRPTPPAPPAPPVAAGVALRGRLTAPGAGFRRLPHSRAEARAILGLVPPARSFQALDFDASKQTVQSGRLADYRIVHFATHGFLDTERPALSGVVLSQVDRRGEPVEGFLRAHEIYNLRLPADLVVLGGCETALGKEVRGEGLVGLTRGFMYAGASRVMVSLWKVSDRGTADLMAAFYRNLLQGGLPPAAALRQAQLELRAAGAQPFYWAGFLIQGDWRGSPAGG